MGLYFSAHWCPPCRAFTPKLGEAYTNLVNEGKKFEVIFISSDQDEEGFQEYFSEMPFKALAFKDRATKDALAKVVHPSRRASPPALSSVTHPCSRCFVRH